jgi:hypothetical protein
MKKLKLISGSTISANLDAISKIKPVSKIRKDENSKDEIIIIHNEQSDRDFFSYLEEEKKKYLKLNK